METAISQKWRIKCGLRDPDPLTGLIRLLVNYGTLAEVSYVTSLVPFKA